MKRIPVLMLLLLLVPALLFSASASSIYFATDDELRNMCRLRGLPEGPRAEMQEALYQYEGVEAYEEYCLLIEKNFGPEPAHTEWMKGDRQQ